MPRFNPVALLAGVIGLLALVNTPFFAPGWLLLKANRLVLGEGYGPFALSFQWSALLGLLWLAVIALSFVPFRARAYPLAYLVSAALVVSILFVGAGTRQLLVGTGPSARVSLMGGVWFSMLAYYIGIFAALFESREGYGGRWVGPLLVAPGLLAAFALILGGEVNELGLARELVAQGGGLSFEILRHLGLSATSVLIAAAIAIPAAIWSARREDVAAWVLPVASLLQTLPSLALFGLMLAPLAVLGRNLSVGGALLIVAVGVALAVGLGWLLARFGDAWPRFLSRLGGIVAVLVGLAPLVLLATMVAVVLDDLIVAVFSLNFADFPLPIGLSQPLNKLGVRGIGTAPALIALTLYALLPIVRNCYVGIKEVPRAALEAGRGMGMSPGQILRRVELPLALPLIIGGVRASAVLTIGITTVAYLIGAGGLGQFIQKGIDQVVPDLILLGAIPVILLALLVDGLLRVLGALLTSPGIRREGA
jgi:osmoprotectant transport system permease protein